MKTQVSTAVLALLGQVSAQSAPNSAHPAAVYPLEFHWNEDYHSVPNPLNGKPYLTSTQAKYVKNGQTDLASEPLGVNPIFHEAHNKYAKEPTFVEIDSESESDSESDSDSEEDMNVQWGVSPDYGEYDHDVVPRFKDAGNGFKHNGWTNPLSWTDNGNDDEGVLVLTKTDGTLVEVKDETFLQYAESEGPTKVDFGELDQAVVPRFKDAGNGFKHNGWTNPLSWTDNGEDDEIVLLQQRQRMNYEHSDFDVPADNGIGDENVVNFVQLSDEQDGEEEDDNTEAQLTAESIITQQKYQVDRGYGDEEVL